MLNRGFNPAKCKTSLGLAMSRIKVLKNKKEAVYIKLKRDVALLLQSGDDRTARIRVEHVIMEEKTIAAYEIINIYCQLILHRISMIHTQRNCPIDLKEAIASVMFATPRCSSDIPELLDITKRLSAKYGKDFTTSAVEMRPNSGVSRSLVEKLSTVAPDTQTKILVMTSIAEEHSIIWEPPVGENDEMLHASNRLENVHIESPILQAAPSFKQMPDVPVNHYEYEQNRYSSLRLDSFSSAGASTSKTMSASPRPEPRPSPKSEGRDREQSFSGEINDFSPGKQNCNMEFKDATSAAQAAAEAAEVASWAARAAAELSIREDTKIFNSQKSQKSTGSRDECRSNYAGPTMQSEHPTQNYGNKSFHGRSSEQTNDRKDEDDELDLAAETAKLRSRSKKSSNSASLKSSSVSMADDLPVKKNDEYSQMSSPKAGLVKPKRNDDYSDEETVYEKFHEVSQKGADKTSSVEKQFSGSSSRHRSSDHEKFGDDLGHNLFGRGGIHIEQSRSYGHRVLDSSESDDDKGSFDKVVYDVEETDFFPSPERETPTHTKSYLLREEDRSMSQSKSNVLDKLQEVAFGHSDGPGSENEEEESMHNFSPTKISPRNIIVSWQLDFDEINRYSSVEDKSSRHSNETSETPNEKKDVDFLKLSSVEESSFSVLTNNPRHWSSDSDSDDFVHVPKKESRVKNEPKVDPPPRQGRVVFSRRTRAGNAEEINYSPEMKAFLQGSGG